MSRRPRILILEDNPETRHLLERVLTLQGYLTMSAVDVASAESQLRTGPRPSVIVLDLHLPGTDGRAFLRDLKADPELGSIPVVVYSGDPSYVPDAAAFIRKGTDDPDTLLGAIAACIGEAPGAS
jgi:CheY-like chemotaxis protein